MIDLFMSLDLYKQLIIIENLYTNVESFLYLYKNENILLNNKAFDIFVKKVGAYYVFQYLDKYNFELTELMSININLAYKEDIKHVLPNIPIRYHPMLKQFKYEPVPN